MQENTSDNSTNPTQGKQPLQDYYLNGGEKYNQPQTDPARNKKIAVAIVAAVIVVALVIIIAVSVGGNSMGGIEIVGFLRSQLLRRRQPARKRSGKLYYACPRRRSLSARPERQRLPHVVLSRILLQDHQVARLLLTLRKSVIIIFL